MEFEATSEPATTALPDKAGAEWLMELLDAAKQELQQREYRIAQLERQLELAQSELERARDRSGKLEYQSGAQEEQIASLNIRLAEMAEQIQQLEHDLGKADGQLKASEKLDQLHRSETRRLEADNATLALTNEEQARRIRALDQIIDGYVASNARIRGDFEKLRVQLKRPVGLAG